MIYFIRHNSLNGKIQTLENNLQTIGSAAKFILAIAGRVRPVEEFPTFICILLPRREASGWDRHAGKQLNKVDTAERVSSLQMPLLDEDMQQLQHNIRAKRMRKETLHSLKSEPHPVQHPPLRKTMQTSEQSTHMCKPHP